jgi:hypothetical protein
MDRFKDPRKDEHKTDSDAPCGLPLSPTPAPDSDLVANMYGCLADIVPHLIIDTGATLACIGLVQLACAPVTP